MHSRESNITCNAFLFESANSSSELVSQGEQHNPYKLQNVRKFDNHIT